VNQMLYHFQPLSEISYGKIVKNLFLSRTTIIKDLTLGKC